MRATTFIMAPSKKQIYLILHNVRSVHNVGSIFRTADACDVKKIYLTGLTPAPIDKFGIERKDLSKVALGAEKNISWEKYRSASTVIKKLKKEGFLIVSLEQSPTSTDYKKIKVKDETVFIVGNEVDGLPESILKNSDLIAEIPMQGKKESLNVSVAAGVMLFRVLNI